MKENQSEQDKSYSGLAKWPLRLRLFLADNQWILVGIVWVVTYILCWIGIYKQFLASGEIRSIWDPFYRVFQLFFFDDSMVVSGVIHSWELEIGRFLAPAVAMYTAFAALIALFNDQIQTIRLGLMRKHIVVCGVGRKGLGLVRDYRNRGFKVVAIEIDEKNDNIGTCREMKALVIEGDATDSDVLRKAHVHMAAKVVAITGNDGTNVEIAVRTYHLVKGRDKTIHHTVKCFVQVVDSKLRVLFNRHPIFTEISDPFEINIFNTYTNSSRLMFDRFPLDRTGIKKDDPWEAHLIIIGFGQMGESVLLQAAKTSHFANEKKLHVRIIDRLADKKSKHFHSHYSQINSICTTEFISIEAEDPDLIENILRWSKNENTWTSIVVAIDDDAQALSCALGFLMKLDNPEIPIIVRMSEEEGLALLLGSEATKSAWMASLKPFGMTGDICNSRMLTDEKLDLYARKIHKINVTKRTREGKSIDDSWLCSWEELKPDIKEANRQQADHLGIKLRAIGCSVSTDDHISGNFNGFSEDEIELMARMEHRRWVAECLLAGWTPGPKDHDRRQSPYLVEWDKLDDTIKVNDRDTVRNIPEILALAGKKIIRNGNADSLKDFATKEA
jgi:voltage-gated potassium channel Kch